MTLAKNQQTHLKSNLSIKKPKTKKVNSEEFNIQNGWLNPCQRQPSPHFSQRHSEQAQAVEISLLVIHNISLPPNQFSQHSEDHNYITDLFLGQLDGSAHPSFADIVHLKVSAHCFIRRNGDVIQYVSFDDKAWHAGISSFKGKEACNDFSIGIELEGNDFVLYTDIQYQKLTQITQLLQQCYPLIDNNHIVGHNDIAPGRKTDPGESFDWQRYQQSLDNHLI